MFHLALCVVENAFANRQPNEAAPENVKRLGFASADLRLVGVMCLDSERDSVTAPFERAGQLRLPALARR